MGRGILLEKEGHRAVVLTASGEFRRVTLPLGNPALGDEIEFAETRAGGWLSRSLTVAAAAAMLLLLPVGYQAWALAQPVAFVTVDINPSIQLTLNKRDQVLHAEGLNADGLQLLQQVEWKHRSVAEVVEAITIQAMADGKLDPVSESGTVLVAVVPMKDRELPQAVAERIADETKASATSAISKKADEQKAPAKVTVAAVQVTVKEKDAAAALGMSPGHFVILREIQEKVPDVGDDALKNQGPGGMLHDLGINPGSIFSQAENRRSDKANDKANDKTNGRAQDREDEDADEEAEPASGKRPEQTGKPAENPGQSGKATDSGKSAGSTGPGKSDQAPGQTRESEGRKGQSEGEEDEDESEIKKRETWKVPLLPIEIPKPSFLQDRSEKRPAPQAEQPGARPATPGQGRIGK